MKYIKDNIVYDEYRGILNADGKLVLGMTRAEILSLGYTPFLGNDLNDDGRTNDFCLRPYYIDFYSLYGETEALTQDVVLDTDLDDAITAYEDGRELVIRYWGELPEGSTDLKSVQESGEAKINAVYYFSSVEPGNLIFRSSFPVSMIDTARYTKSNYNCIALSTITTPKVLHFLPSSDSYVSQVQVEELTEEEYVDLTKNAQGNFIVNSGSSSAEVADYVRYVESSSPNIIRIFRRVSSKDASGGGSMSTSGNSASYIFSEINETSNSINILVCTLGQGSIAGGDWQLIENLYQKALVSGENIKTINNESLLGSGDVQVGDITGEELETEIEELESTLLTDALRKSEQVLLPAEKTQVLTNLGIADVAKESNLKTVNGVSLVGTGNIEIVSVDAGDINVMQGTGDSQIDVMSQKAVSKQVERLTSEDLKSRYYVGLKLPNGYTMLDYIDNDFSGTQGAYIETNLTQSDPGWRFVGSWARTQAISTSNAGIYHNYQNGGNQSSYGLYASGTDETKIKAVAYNRYNTAYTITLGDSGLNVWHTFDLEYGTLTLDGTSYPLSTTAPTSQSTIPLCTGSAYPMRIGPLVAYHNNEMVAHLIPCKTNTDVGMYDVLGEVFYTSANSVDFVAGNEIAPPANKLLSGEGLLNFVTQETGDNTCKVMSQLAVTEYGRKSTTDDLAGTSEWISMKLTEEGWALGTTLRNGGALADVAGYCTSPYLPISDIKGHDLTLCYNYAGNSIVNICFYDSNKSFISGSGLYYTATLLNIRTITIGTSETWDNVAFVRITVNQNKIPECYFLDRTTGVFIFKGEEYLIELQESNNVSCESFENYLVSQEVGESTTKVMSQKAIKDAINYNVNIERGTSVAIDGSLYTKLNEYQASVLNYSDIMSVRFLVSGSDGGSGSNDWRYIALGTDGHLINFSSAGAPILSWYATNQGMLSSGGVHPVVATIVINRVTGVVDYYKNTTLICSDTQDRYKKDNFVTSARVMKFSGGDYSAKFYGVQLYDCDISKFWRNARYKNNEINAVQSEVVRPFILTYDQSHEWVAIGSATSVYQTSWYTITDNGDGTATMIRKDGTKGVFYFTGYTPAYNMIYETDFYCDKPFTFASPTNTTQLYNEEGELLAESTNSTAIPFEAGRYKIRFYWYQSGNGITTTEDGATITIYSKRRRYVGCLAHFDFSTLYNKKLYDNVSNQFYTLYTDSTLKTESLTHELSQLPLRGIYTAGNLSVPHYVGEIKVYNGKIYIADNTWTWKQINNS